MRISERTLSEADRAVLHDLVNQTRSVLAQTLQPSGSGVALLDFPSHQNVGDTMIWAGELAHLQALGTRVHYVADHARYSRGALERHAPGAAVLLHGGGNLGDIWPDYQAFRERVINDLRDARIIQLPQTIWFQSSENAKRANDAFASHPNFTLLIREHQSMERAQEWLPNVNIRFCPDAALGMGHQFRRDASPGALVKLLRGDSEAVSGRDAALVGLPGDTTDWGLGGAAQGAWKVARIAGKIHTLAPASRDRLYPLVARGYDSMAKLNLVAGRTAIGSARALLTDRLHAHVMACLMGIPHVVVDNNYGKVGAVFRSYTHRFSTATYAGSLSEAASAWHELTTGAVATGER